MEGNFIICWWGFWRGFLADFSTVFLGFSNFPEATGFLGSPFFAGFPKIQGISRVTRVPLRFYKKLGFL